MLRRVLGSKLVSSKLVFFGGDWNIRCGFMEFVVLSEYFWLGRPFGLNNETRIFNFFITIST